VELGETTPIHELPDGSAGSRFVFNHRLGNQNSELNTMLMALQVTRGRREALLRIAPLV
jgi:hypothetical protein